MQKKVTKELLAKWLDEAEHERDCYMLALYDQMVGKVDLMVKIKDFYKDRHEVHFSRLAGACGIVLDVNKDNHDIATYYLMDIETGDGYAYLADYLKEAVGKARAKRDILLAPLRLGVKGWA